MAVKSDGGPSVAVGAPAVPGKAEAAGKVKAVKAAKGAALAVKSAGGLSVEVGASAVQGKSKAVKAAQGAAMAVKSGGQPSVEAGAVGGGSLGVSVLIQDGAPAVQGRAKALEAAKGVAVGVKSGGAPSVVVGAVGGGSVVVPVLIQDGAPAVQGQAKALKAAQGAAVVVKSGGGPSVVVGAVGGGGSVVVPVLIQDGAPAVQGQAKPLKKAQGAAMAVKSGGGPPVAVGAGGGGSVVVPVLSQASVPAGSGKAKLVPVLSQTGAPAARGVAKVAEVVTAVPAAALGAKSGGEASVGGGAVVSDPEGSPVLLQDRASIAASAAVARAVDQLAHLRLLAEARGAAAWTESALIDRAVARADAERAVLAAAKLERTVIYAVARAEFDSAGAGSLGEAAFESAVRKVAVSRIPDGIKAAGSPISVRALSARIRTAEPTGAGNVSALASQVSHGSHGGGVAFCGAVLGEAAFETGVPDGGNLTGGRARHRGALLRAANLPVPIPLFSQEEREARVARRAVVIRERRAKRGDMIGLRALLHHLGAESQVVLGEVHGDDWRPHRWAHWIFPCSAMVAEVPASFLTLRTADAFVEADSFAWREVVERIVGKAESTVGGLHAFFAPFVLARIDCFVSTLSQVRRRPVWLLRLLQRLRRLRGMMPGDLAVGPLSRPVSRPSKRGRAGMRQALLLSMANLHGGGSAVAPGAVAGAVPLVVPEDGLGSMGSRSAVVSPVSSVRPVLVAATVSAGPDVTVRVSGVPTRVPKQAPYLRRRPGNASIEKLLARGAALRLPDLLRGGV